MSTALRLRMFRATFAMFMGLTLLESSGRALSFFILN